uniref:Uncharacterized protein n=1 Tax=Physcomitrium patens TaxID=3218 RepID=A0A2K1IBF9_PHYPA|nr:hypothetical protein PHYPA_030086 [Physcomitrium patens]
MLITRRRRRRRRTPSAHHSAIRGIRGLHRNLQQKETQGKNHFKWPTAFVVKLHQTGAYTYHQKTRMLHRNTSIESKTTHSYTRTSKKLKRKNSIPIGTKIHTQNTTKNKERETGI